MAKDCHNTSKTTPSIMQDLQNSKGYASGSWDPPLLVNGLMSISFHRTEVAL